MDLEDFIQEALDSEFGSDKKKTEINETKTGYNFSCPFCGDSAKSYNKRGNIYLNSKTYKCFNDGCMTWMPLKKFVSVLSRKYDIDISDLEIDFEADTGSYDKLAKIDDNDIMRFLSDTGALGTMLDMEYVRDRFSLINIRSLPTGSEVRQYLEKRLIFNVPGVDDYIYADPGDKTVFIFNYHKATGKILSLATRKIDYKKYKVIPYSHICKSLHLEMAEDHASTIDQLGEYFNLLNIDMDKPIRVTEGQIDSIFLQNAIAVQGVTKSRFFIDNLSHNNIWTMFDRDKAGIEQSVKELQIGHRAFMWSLLIKRLKRKYSPDNMKLLKIKDTNDLYVFMYDNTKLPLWRFNALVDDYFTSSRFDMIYL